MKNIDEIEKYDENEMTLDAKEIAWRLIKDNPYRAMEYLDYSEDVVEELFNALTADLKEEKYT